MGCIWLCITEIVEEQSILSRNGKIQCLEEQHCLWNKRCRVHGLPAEAFWGPNSHYEWTVEGERQRTDVMWYFWALWPSLQQCTRGQGLVGTLPAVMLCYWGKVVSQPFLSVSVSYQSVWFAVSLQPSRICSQMWDVGTQGPSLELTVPSADTWPLKKDLHTENILIVTWLV